MLYNQILRGVAALSVVFYHSGFRLSGYYETQFFAVPTFFVISGFIMCHITQDGPANFLQNRIIRIIPMYWICTLALVLITFKLPIELISGTLPTHLFRSLSFIPSGEHPVLDVGWTLNYEIYFYLVFAASLWLSSRHAPLVAICALYYVFALAAIFPDVFLFHFYSNPCIHYFVAGIAIFYAFTLSPRPPPIPTVIVVIGTLAASYGSQFAAYDGWNSIAPILIVASVLFAEKSGAFTTAKWLIILGDASYAIYLTHPTLIRILYSHLTRWASNPKENVWLMIGYVTASAGVGIAVHLYLEKPMLRFLRDRMQREKLRSPEVSTAR